jgi:hypothetical protein
MKHQTQWRAVKDPSFEGEHRWMVIDWYESIVAHCGGEETAKLIAHDHNEMMKYVEQCANLSGFYVPSERAVSYRTGI